MIAAKFLACADVQTLSDVSLLFFASFWPCCFGVDVVLVLMIHFLVNVVCQKLQTLVLLQKSERQERWPRFLKGLEDSLWLL